MGQHDKLLDSTSFLSFIGLIMWMGHLRLPEISMYWSRRPINGQLPFGNVFPRDKFHQILRYIRANDSEKPDILDGFWRFRPMIKMLNTTFQRYWKPGSDMCIDEDMIPYLGRNKMLQYLPRKAHKHGFRVWKLCDNSDYLVSFDIYAGKEYNKMGYKRYDWGEEAVISLLQELQMPTVVERTAPRRLYTDNFFTTVQLARELRKKGIYLTGTIRKNRIGLPADWLDKDLLPARYSHLWKMTPDGILLYRWKETNEVLFLSTAYGPSMTTIRRWHDGVRVEVEGPLVGERYNHNMGSCDRHNRACSTIAFHRKSMKWTHSIFFYLMQCAIVNAWVAYKVNAPNALTIHEFHMRLAESLLNLTQQNLLEVRSLRRPPLHHLRKAKKRAMCVVCQKLTSSTPLRCHGCKAHMHKKCYDRRHNDTVQ